MTAPGGEPGADDDLVARRTHFLDRLQTGGRVFRRAPAVALRRRLSRAAADVAVHEGPEPLDDIAVVRETCAEQLDQEQMGDGTIEE